MIGRVCRVVAKLSGVLGRFARKAFQHLFGREKMDRLFSQDSHPLTELEHAGIAVCRLRNGGRHAGVLYRSEGTSDVILLHLAWHHDLRNETPSQSYFWLRPAVPQRRLRQVAAMCRMVWRANGNGGIPYAFDPPNDSFNSQTGGILLGPTRHGLTCATFVLAIFEAAGLCIATYDSWPIDRKGDRDWQKWVIEQLETSNPPAANEHIEAVRSQIGCARFRPEEVAGAALGSPLPASFDVASKNGLLVLRRLHAS